jgi:Domain of unknown function DUF11
VIATAISTTRVFAGTPSAASAECQPRRYSREVQGPANVLTKLTWPSHSGSIGGSNRGLVITRRGRARITLAALVGSSLLVVGLGGAGAAAADSPCPPPSGRQLCVSVTHTPPEVSAASAAGQTFVSFTVTLQNVGKSELTQTTVTACLVGGSESSDECGPAPPGASFYSAVASAGNCTTDGATARCVIGKLKRGATATADLVARAPTQAGPFLNVVSATVKERGSDSPRPDPQADTITVSEPVTTLAAGGPRAISFVPDGVATELLAADEGQSGLSKIPSAHDDLTAELAITDDPPFVCPKGEICRGGGWVSATIPGTFDALQFVLHWPDKFVSFKQTTKNFVLFYIACDTCELEIIRDRCSSATPSAEERPCLWNIRDLGKKGFEATLISSVNGKMH